VVAFVSFVIVFVGGLRYRTLLVGSLLVIPAAVLAWLDLMRENPLVMGFFKNSYHWERVETLLHPVAGTDEYWQMEQSLYSIGSGGLYGKGFGNNTYVVNGYNDFIFATVAEQFGFVGCVLLLGVMAFLIIKCILIALHAFDLQGRMIAAGVAGLLLFETFVNVGVVTSLLPNTGIPFPFLSYGGTSIWIHMLALGLVINVGKPREKSMFEGS
jgi:rod shape determining protein RodA